MTCRLQVPDQPQTHPNSKSAERLHTKDPVPQAGLGMNCDSHQRLKRWRGVV
jgi:hypothetical protein